MNLNTTRPTSSATNIENLIAYKNKLQQTKDVYIINNI